MKFFFLLSVTAFLTSCAFTQKQSTSTTQPARSIASLETDEGIEISGYHSGEHGPISAEDMALTGRFLQDEFGFTAPNFRMLNQTPDANGRMHFTFKISRADGLRIVDSRVPRFRNYNPGQVRTPEQINKDQATANCMLANYTVSNFLAEFSAMDGFQFKFNVPEPTRKINLRTGEIDNTNPRCEIWGEQSRVDAILYVQ